MPDRRLTVRTGLALGAGLAAWFAAWVVIVAMTAMFGVSWEGLGQATQAVLLVAGGTAPALLAALATARLLPVRELSGSTVLAVVMAVPIVLAVVGIADGRGADEPVWQAPATAVGAAAASFLVARTRTEASEAT